MMTQEVDALVADAHQALWTEISADPSLPSRTSGELARCVRRIVASRQPLASTSQIETVIAEVLARVDGLGPLHEFGLDPAVSEIMVNGDGTIWLERLGELTCTDRHLDVESVENLIRRLAANAGRRIDTSNPSVDVRLADGSRLHAIIPPLAVDGPCITIRRFRTNSPTLPDMADAEAEAILRAAVLEEQTVVVAGGTSSGKTTLLGALAGEIDRDARIITIEDAAELALGGRHVVRLETRHRSEGVCEVTLRDLARHALRMRPDRIICGEMRGAEALDLIQAMNTGHRGSMSTVHGNTPVDVMRRIETMMLLGDAELPLRAIRDQLRSCIDLVVMMRRHGKGERRVSSISRVCNDPGDEWRLDPLYEADAGAVR